MYFCFMQYVPSSFFISCVSGRNFHIYIKPRVFVPKNVQELNHIRYDDFKNMSVELDHVIDTLNFNIRTISINSVLDRMGFPQNWKNLANIERSRETNEQQYAFPFRIRDHCRSAERRKIFRHERPDR